MSILQTKMYKGYKINIHSDDDPTDPRGDDNLGTMLCFHSRYNLGDKKDAGLKDFQGSLQELIKEVNACVALPLYLYDHSGVSMSCSHTYPYNDRWDSSTIGIIYVTAEKIRKEYSVKSINKAIKDKVTSILEGEVETYNQYLTGDCYGYEVLKITKCDHCSTENKEQIDSCWGYLGDMDQCLADAKAMVDTYPERTTSAEIITA